MKTWKQTFIGLLAIIAIGFAFIACNDGDGKNEPETVATPIANLAEGTTYTGTQNVTLSTTTAGANIYYTLDGTPPTASNTKYSTAITITDNVTIKAIAAKSGMNNSGIMTAIYTFEPANKGPFITGDLFEGKTASIKDERINGGSQNLQELNIVTKIEGAITAGFNGVTGPLSGPNKNRFRNVFGAAGGVTIIVNNPETYYEGILTPNAKTMTFHINYLQSDPPPVLSQKIIDAVTFMNDPANFE